MPECADCKHAQGSSVAIMDGEWRWAYSATLRSAMRYQNLWRSWKEMVILYIHTVFMHANMPDFTSFAPERGVGQVPSRLNLAPKSMRFWLMAHKVAAGFDSSAPSAASSGLRNFTQDATGAFLFAVTGDSMCGAGIMEGDKVVVDRSVAPAHGRLVIAIVNGAYTLKRLFHFNGRFELRSENDTRPPERIAQGATPDVWGVVVGVIRHVTPP